MQSIKDHLHRSGKHTAELSTSQNQAVTHETVKPSQQEHINTAVDREVHEHHHQTQVQPIQHREVNATEHHENVMPVEHRQHHHGHDSQVKEKLGAIANSFGDKQHLEETQHVQGDQNQLVGEHRHHHVHQTVQPIVQKETIQPHVVHTTVPVHERVELEPTVHNATVAKPMSMDQFKQQVGVGSGDNHEKIHYEGDPLSVNKDANVGFMHEGKYVGSSHQDKTNTGLMAGTREALGNLTGHGSSASGVTHDNTNTGLPVEGGRSGVHNQREHQHHSGVGVGAGSAGATMAAQTAAHHHHRDQNTTGSSTDHNRKMPGEYVHDSSAPSSTSERVPRTVGHDPARTGDANPTGFMDGRSPNDNKAEKEKSGGVISGLINKMKS